LYICKFIENFVQQYYMDVFWIRNEVLKQLCASLFSNRYSDPIRNFLLPYIAGDAQFPFVILLQSMLPPLLISGQISPESDWALTVESSLWLLHSTLCMAEAHLGKSQYSSARLSAVDVHLVLDRAFTSSASGF
jgi:hypothetical protein